MSAESSWSLRGVDPKAREAARNAARREGLSVGEWVNRRLTSEGDAPADPDSPEGLARALERLSRRIEAAEHRSTLAITGIDQSVLGLIARMQGIEDAGLEHAQVARRGVDELRKTQEALATRIRQIEADDTSDRSLEALKSLEASLAKLAAHVYDNDGGTKEHLEAIEAELDRRTQAVEDSIASLSKSLATNVGDLSKRVDTHTEHAALQLRRLRDDMEARFDTNTETLAGIVRETAQQADTRFGGLETALERVDQRLQSAESMTNNAIRALEASFASLDDRLRAAEVEAAREPTLPVDVHALGAEVADTVETRLAQRLDQTVAGRVEREVTGLRDSVAADVAQRVIPTIAADVKAAVSASLDARLDARLDAGLETGFAQTRGQVEGLQTRFEGLGRQVSDLIAETRAEIAHHLESAAATGAAADNSRLESIVAQLDARIEAAETRHRAMMERVAGEVAKIAGAVESRVRSAERRAESVARSVAADTGEVDRIIETRLREIERSNAGAVSRVGDELSRVAERLTDKISAHERRSAEAMETVSSQVGRITERLQSRHDQSSDDLTRRIRESEERTARMIEDALGGVYKRVDETSDQTKAVLSPVRQSLQKLSQRLEALEDRALPTFAPAPAASAEFDIAPPPFDAVGGPFGPEAGRSASPFAPPASAGASARPAPKPRADAPPPPPAQAAFQPAAPMPPPAQPPLSEARTSEPPRSAKVGGAKSAPVIEPKPLPGAPYLSAARRAALTTPTEGRDGPGFGPASSGKTPKHGRRILMGAGGAAFIAVGAAFAMMFADGLKGGGAATQHDDLDDLLSPEPSTPAGQKPAATLSSEPAESRSIDAAFGQPLSADDPVAGSDGLDPEPLGEPGDAAVETIASAPISTIDDVASSEDGQPNATGDDVFTLEPEPETSLASDEGGPVPAEPTPSPETTLTPETALAPEPAPAAETGAASIEAAAAGGDAIAQFQLGAFKVESGDFEAGRTLLTQAANSGVAMAQYRLAKMYETGEGGAPDLGEARIWTERAAAAGNRKAMHNLAIFYAEGRGAPQDFAAAARWFEEASLMGLKDSQYNLAILYEQGLGVPLSPADAYAWFSIAGKSGDEDAVRRAQALGATLQPAVKGQADATVERFKPRPFDPVANGRFRDTPWAAPALTGASAVARAQALLGDLGYQAGPPDGAMGPRTRDALLAFQRANGLEQTGRADAATLNRLELDAQR